MSTKVVKQLELTNKKGNKTDELIQQWPQTYYQECGHLFIIISQFRPQVFEALSAHPKSGQPRFFSWHH